MSNLPVTLADIRAAAAAIGEALEHTPTRKSRTLSNIAGCDIWLKFENMQFTASFKERGALNKLLSLSAAERMRGVIAMSAGNHAQGVAYHAGRLGIPATIVMPETTPFGKIKHTQDFGANVVLEGVGLAEATAKAKQLAADQNLVFVHPFDDPHVIAGQGTLALEMLADAPDLDALVIPVGGGGLISGIAVAAKAIKPDIEIYGVQAEGFPSMYAALTGKPADFASQTVAEGIAVREPGKLAAAIAQDLVREVLLVGEDDIEQAIASLLEIEKTVVEGAGAAGFAAVMAHPDRFAGKKVGLVLSGGNIDMRMLSNVILRGLSREGRIQSLVVAIDDRPGTLATISTLIGKMGGNILEVSHNRMATDTSAKLADLGITVEARDATHAAAIRKAIEDAGFKLKV